MAGTAIDGKHDSEDDKKNDSGNLTIELTDQAIVIRNGFALLHRLTTRQALDKMQKSGPPFCVTRGNAERRPTGLTS